MNLVAVSKAIFLSSIHLIRNHMNAVHQQNELHPSTSQRSQSRQIPWLCNDHTTIDEIFSINMQHTGAQKRTNQTPASGTVTCESNVESVNSTTAITYQSINSRIPEDEAIAARIRKEKANLYVVSNDNNHNNYSKHTCSQ